MTQDDAIATVIRQVLEKYFRDLDGAQPHQVYNMLQEKVEKPLLEVVLSHTKGNQTNAATILGINRNTLRKKLKMYKMD